MGAGISGGSCIELSSVDRQDAAKLNATTTHAPTNGPKIPQYSQYHSINCYKNMLRNGQKT